MVLNSLFAEEIKISSISSPKNSLRQEPGDIEELAESIGREGLIEPIVVRPKEGKFELVAGSRRLAACRQLKWRKIRCQIVTLDDREAFEIGLAENVARKTLDPLEEARAFEDYVTNHGWGSEIELAKKIGKSPSYISRRLRLLTLPPEALNEILRRHNNPSLLEEILRIEDDTMRMNLVNMSPELKLSSKEVRRLREKLNSDSNRDRTAGWIQPPKTEEERRSRLVNLSCQRTVLALRVALYRLDEIVESVKNKDWILAEILMQQRQALHSQIDQVCNLAKRIEVRDGLD
jgi:ParB family chromosome partitioning protein